MNYLPHSEAAMEHYNDLRREADQVRLAREARKAQQRSRFYQPLFAWVSCRFAVLKMKLSRKPNTRRTASMRPVTEPSPCQN